VLNTILGIMYIFIYKFIFIYIYIYLLIHMYIHNIYIYLYIIIILDPEAFLAKKEEFLKETASAVAAIASPSGMYIYIQSWCMYVYGVYMYIYMDV
jgi:hypothetical protein